MDTQLEKFDDIIEELELYTSLDEDYIKRLKSILNNIEKEYNKEVK